MANTFLDKKIEDFLQDADKAKEIQIAKELEALHHPNTVNDLLQILKTGLSKKNSTVNRSFRLIKNLDSEEFFPYVLDILKSVDESIHIQYGMQALSNIPKDARLVKRYIPDILSIIASAEDHKVLYQGVVLLYRISKSHPQLDSMLNEKSVKVTLPLFQDAMHMASTLENWEDDFHRHSDVRSELNSTEEFFNFANQFIAF